MKQEQKNSSKTELEKACDAGFTEVFIFHDAQLCHCSDGAKRYNPKDLEIAPRPCVFSNHILYRITTSSGIRGIAINVPADTLNDY